MVTPLLFDSGIGRVGRRFRHERLLRRCDGRQGRRAFDVVAASAGGKGMRQRQRIR